MTVFNNFLLFLQAKEKNDPIRHEIFENENNLKTLKLCSMMSQENQKDYFQFYTNSV